MSTKDLFRKGNKVLTKSQVNKIEKDLESEELVKEIVESNTRFLSHVNYSKPGNFAFYGSAEKYYEDSFDRVYKTYPYDGSHKEKQEWLNNSSELDLWILNNAYPKSVGHVRLGANQSIFVKGGPNNQPGVEETDPEELSKQFPVKQGNSNIWNPSIYRNSNLHLDPNLGFTVEFWMKFDDPEANNIVPFVIGNSSGTRVSIRSVGGGSGMFNISFYDDAFSGGTQFNATGLNDLLETTWNHYSFSFINSGDKVKTEIYKNGVLRADFLNGTTVGAISQEELYLNINGLMNNITAARTNVVDGMYIDEFRFWKQKRTAEETGRYWNTNIHGGTNTDDDKYSEENRNVDIGIYYKFNEGITGDDTIDATVLDYSGRISNGTIVNYSNTVRSTTSALDEYGQFILPEEKDYVVYSQHPEFISTKDTYMKQGLAYDMQNNSSIYHTMPAWITEEDEYNGSNIKELSQVISSYFDNAQIQIQELTNLKEKEYYSLDNETEKPFHLIRSTLESQGLSVPDLFTETTAFEEILSRGETALFEEKLQDVKNTIYQNIYNNLSYIYKAKGTEKAFRNLIRCFGIDDELVKINLYSDDADYTLEDTRRPTAIKKKFVDFNDADRQDGLVYTKEDPSAPGSISHIKGVGRGRQPNLAFTFQTEVIFPKRISKDHPKYDPPSQTVEHIAYMGTYTGGYNSETSLFDLIAVKENNNPLSENVKFVLDFNGQTIETGFFKSVYDNSKWNIAVRLVPKKRLSSLVAGGENTDFTAELYCVRMLADTVEDEEWVVATVLEADAREILNVNKFVSIGASKVSGNPESGAAKDRTRIKISSTLFWYDEVTNEEIRAHASDASNFGRLHPNEEAYAFDAEFNDNSANAIQVLRRDTLALHWDFSEVKSTDALGEFVVDDLSPNIEKTYEPINTSALSFDGTSAGMSIDNSVEAFRFTLDESASDANPNLPGTPGYTPPSPSGDLPFSISAWCYVDQTTAIPQVIVSKWCDGQGAGTKEYFFAISNTRKVMFILYDDISGTGHQLREITTTSVPLNQWFHLTATYGANSDFPAPATTPLSSLNTDIKIYLNGVEMPSSNSGSNRQYEAMPARRDDFPSLTIGNTQNASLDRPFHGDLADICIFSKKLSDKEVLEVYNNSSVKNMEEFTDYDFIVAWYRMGDADDGAGANGIKDYVGGYHGTMPNDVSIQPAPALNSDLELKSGRYGWFTNLVGWQVNGRGKHFFPEDNQVVNREFVYSSKHRTPEVINSEDLVEIRVTDDENFTRDAKVTTHFFAAEKSMYQTISDDMINLFATIVEFNDLIGQPVNRYRPQYKALEKFRARYYEKVKNVPSLEKYVELYKWIDTSIGLMLQELIPVSSNFSADLRNMVESHVLERNKYWSKFPTMEMSGEPPLGIVKGINELTYNWEQGHAPVGTETIEDDKFLYGDQRFTVLTGDTDVDKNREILRRVATRNTLGNNKLVERNGEDVIEDKPVLREPPSGNISGATYSAQAYVTRALSKPYKLNLDIAPTIHGGVNYSPSTKDPNSFVRASTKISSSSGITVSFGTNPVFYQGFSYDDQPVKRTVNVVVEDALVDFAADGDFIYPYYETVADPTPEITNLQNDSYGEDAEIPAQGPFTETWVGGNQHRHIEPMGGHELVSVVDVPGHAVFSNGRIIIPDNNDLSFTNGTDDFSFAVSLWVNIDSYQNSYSRLFGKFNLSIGAKEYVGVIFNNGEIRFTVYISGTGTSYTFNSPAGTISLNQWYHIVFDYSTVNDTMTFWVNGQSVGIEQETGTYTNMINTVTDFVIGQSNISQAATTDFSGKMRDFVIFNSKTNGVPMLSADDVAQLYNNNIENHPKYSDIVAWWKLDTNTNSSVNSPAMNSTTVQNVEFASPTFVQTIGGKPELFLDDAGTLRHPFELGQPAARYTREEVAKRPINIRNIKTSSNRLLGNYTRDYEVVQTSSRTKNNRWFVKNEGVTDTLTAAPIVGAQDFALPDRTKDINDEVFGKSKHVIVERFSAPGEPLTLSRGYLDRVAEEFSVYNSINFRNLEERSDHTFDLSAHSALYEGSQGYIPDTNGMPNIHKVNRNTSHEARGKNHDNAFISYQIPRSDFQYNVEMLSPERFAYADTTTENLPHQLPANVEGEPTGSGYNFKIVELEDVNNDLIPIHSKVKISFDASDENYTNSSDENLYFQYKLGDGEWTTEEIFEDGSGKTTYSREIDLGQSVHNPLYLRWLARKLTSSGNGNWDIVNILIEPTSLQKYLEEVDIVKGINDYADYQGAGYRLIKNGEKPQVLRNRRSNIISQLNRSSSDSSDRTTTDYVEPVVTWNKPNTHYILNEEYYDRVINAEAGSLIGVFYEIGSRPITYSYSNNLENFANSDLADAVDLVKQREGQFLDSLVEIFKKADLLFSRSISREIIYPKHKNVGLHKTRFRREFDNYKFFWKDSMFDRIKCSSTTKLGYEMTPEFQALFGQQYSVDVVDNFSYTDGTGYARFNGTSASVIVPDDNSLSFTSGGFAVSMWLNASTLHEINEDTVLFKDGEYFINITSNSMTVGIRDNDTSNILKTVHEYKVNKNQWYHIVMSYDGGLDQDAISLYINGYKVSNYRIDSISSSMDNTTGQLFIGSGSSLYHFNGKIQDLTIVGREVTQGEVSELYVENNITSFSGYDDIVSHWNLYEDALDSVGSNNASSTTDVEFIPTRPYKVIGDLTYVGEDRTRYFITKKGEEPLHADSINNSSKLGLENLCEVSASYDSIVPSYSTDVRDRAPVPSPQLYYNSYHKKSKESDGWVNRKSIFSKESKPAYNDYNSYSEEIRLAAQNYGLVSEFRISEHMDKYIIENDGNFRAKNYDFLTLDGASYDGSTHTLTSGDSVSETSSFYSVIDSDDSVTVQVYPSLHPNQNEETLVKNNAKGFYNFNTIHSPNYSGKYTSTFTLENSINTGIKIEASSKSNTASINPAISGENAAGKFNLNPADTDYLLVSINQQDANANSVNRITYKDAITISTWAQPVDTEEDYQVLYADTNMNSVSGFDQNFVLYSKFALPGSKAGYESLGLTLAVSDNIADIDSATSGVFTFFKTDGTKARLDINHFNHIVLQFVPPNTRDDSTVPDQFPYLAKLWLNGEELYGVFVAELLSTTPARQVRGYSPCQIGLIKGLPWTDIYDSGIVIENDSSYEDRYRIGIDTTGSSTDYNFQSLSLGMITYNFEGSSTTHKFNGFLDELSIFKGLIGKSSIQKLYNEGEPNNLNELMADNLIDNNFLYSTTIQLPPLFGSPGATIPITVDNGEFDFGYNSDAISSVQIMRESFNSDAVGSDPDDKTGYYTWATSADTKVAQSSNSDNRLLAVKGVDKTHGNIDDPPFASGYYREQKISLNPLVQTKELYLSFRIYEGRDNIGDYGLTNKPEYSATAENSDNMYVQYSTDDGTTYQNIQIIEPGNGSSANQPYWDLSQVVSNVVKANANITDIRFLSKNTDSNATDNYDHWGIDDILIFNAEDHEAITEGKSIHILGDTSDNLPPAPFVDFGENYAPSFQLEMTTVLPVWHRIGIPKYDKVSVSSNWDSEFFNSYVHTDNIEFIERANEKHDSLGIDSKDRVSLRVNAIKKLLPYDGFYPQDRTVQIAKLFKEKIEPSILHNESVYKEQALQAALQHFFAPGILYNSIKSGLACDWASYTNESGLEPSYVGDTIAKYNEDGRPEIAYLTNPAPYWYRVAQGSSIYTDGAEDTARFSNNELTASGIAFEGLQHFWGQMKYREEYFATFNGTSSFIEVPDANSLSFTNGPMSISMWLKAVANPDTFGAFNSQRTALYKVGEYYVNVKVQSDGTFQFSLGVFDGDGGSMQINFLKELEFNTWSNVVITYDGTLNQDGVNLFVNGERIDSINTGSIANQMDNTTGVLKIGSGNGNAFYEGSLRDVAIYSQIVSESQAFSLYKNTLDPRDIPNLVSFYTMEDAKDFKGSNDGVATDVYFSQEPWFVDGLVVSKEPNKRLPFEAILDPISYLVDGQDGEEYTVQDGTDPDTGQPLYTNIKRRSNQHYLVNPDYYSDMMRMFVPLSGNDKMEKYCYPYFEINTSSKSKDFRYELAINNFLAESVKFFIKEEKLTTFASKPESEFLSMENGKTYYMDVALKKTDNFSIVNSRDSLGGKYFGPPAAYIKEEVSRNALYPFDGSPDGIKDPAYAPYTPPYFYGESIARISFTATENKKYSLEEIFAGANITYDNPEARNYFISRNLEVTSVNAQGVDVETQEYGAGDPTDGNYQNSVAWRAKMPLSSSVELLGKTRLRQQEYDPSGNPISISTPTGTDYDSWIIYSKFECPLFDFGREFNSSTEGTLSALGITAKTRETRESLSASFLSNSANLDNRDIDARTGSGIWAGYGVQKDGAGVTISLRESFSLGSSIAKGSLLQVCGFKTESKSIGTLANQKEISEAVLMIPYVDRPITEVVSNVSGVRTIAYQTVQVDDRNFIKVDREEYKQQLRKFVRGEPIYTDDSGEEVTSTSMTKMIEGMNKYNVPPLYNFDRYSEEPFIMYFFEFNHMLDKDDLSNIWQGLQPKIAKEASLDSVEISHDINRHEFFGNLNSIPKDVKWMVFKVKKKAEKDYSMVTEDSRDDRRFRFEFDVGTKRPEYGYNYPYDYFTMLEMIQVEARSEKTVDPLQQVNRAIEREED